MNVPNQNNLRLVEEGEAYIVYELPSVEVNLVAKEQLEELKKPDELFFNLRSYDVQTHAIRFSYEKSAEYHNIALLKNGDKDQLKEVVIQLLEVEKLIGTPYTTIIHPINIFINAQGDVKYAHRGIRNVFPNQTLSTAKIVTELRKLFIYLFSDIPFEQIEANTYQLQQDDTFLMKVRQAKTLIELEEIITNHDFNEKKAKKKETSKKEKEQVKEKKEKVSPLKKLSPLTAILIGLIIGMALIYFLQVIPLNNASADEISANQKEAEGKLAALNEENTLLEETLAEQETLVNALHLSLQGEDEAAIQAFESLESLTDVETDLLYDLYVNSNTIENLTKALALGPEYEVTTIRSLVALNTTEANEVVLSWESTESEVEIEQAFLNKEFEQVIAFAEELPEDKRATKLAALSHLELDQHEEALTLGEQLSDVDIQVASLEKAKEVLEADGDLDEEELEERLTEIDEQIETLRDDN